MFTSDDLCSIKQQLGLGPVGAPMGDNVPFDVIMYNEEGEVMEATIANVAIEVENPETGALEWITPPLSSGISAHFFVNFFNGDGFECLRLYDINLSGDSLFRLQDC